MGEEERGGRGRRELVVEEEEEKKRKRYHLEGRREVGNGWRMNREESPSWSSFKFF